MVDYPLISKLFVSFMLNLLLKVWELLDTIPSIYVGIVEPSFMSMLLSLVFAIYACIMSMLLIQLVLICFSYVGDCLYADVIG